MTEQELNDECKVIRREKRRSKINEKRAIRAHRAAHHQLELMADLKALGVTLSEYHEC